VSPLRLANVASVQREVAMSQRAHLLRRLQELDKQVNRAHLTSLLCSFYFYARE
jgi:hypothetical protein